MDKLGELLFLLTDDTQHLPEEYPNVDIKKWAKKTKLQKYRAAKRLVNSLIEELKTDGNS